MYHLVIGGDGFVGSALRKELDRRELPWAASTRRPNLAFGRGKTMFLDMAEPISALMLKGDVSVVYLVAAMSRFIDCETNPDTWRVNVDATIELARHYSRLGAFMVFVSSEAVEKGCGTAYGRQKAFVEMFIHTIDGAVVRPGKIPQDGVERFASLLVDVGLTAIPGVTRWQAGDGALAASNVTKLDTKSNLSAG